MKKKIFLSISLIILFFCFLIFLYLTSDNEKNLVDKKEKTEFLEKNDIKTDNEKIESSNIIEDVSYSAKDTKGNEYFLKAGEGIIDQNESKYIFLKSVKATINLKDYKLIEISSDFGKYNINNYDTIFSKNVMITYLENKITGDYLDFSWEKNLMLISRDVVLENNKNSLHADVIEVDIENRDIKIFMYEDNKKVNIKSF
tara:strand:- start:1580 stop:2179 length:600 start_codon:yes stop_codon:yes gene_type:complete